MKLHANAPLSPKGRKLLIDRIERESQSVQDVAESMGISKRTARKWLARSRAEGPLGLIDRPSAPRVVANRSDEQVIEAIAALRRLRFTGPEIAEILDRPVSTVSGILTRIGMGKLGRLGLQPAQRYERQVAGELIRTMLGGWAYGAIYATSSERAAALDGWIYRYNHHRRHPAIGRQPPITRLNNLLGSYSWRTRPERPDRSTGQAAWVGCPAMAVASVPALFEPVAGRFEAAPQTRGPWDKRMMHGGAPSALLAHTIELLTPGEELAVSRVTIEFLGAVPVGTVSVNAGHAKPGKRFQIVDATLHAAGERAACMARAVRLRREQTPEAQASPAAAGEALPPPEACDALPQWDIDGGDELFYPAATEIRQARGELGSGHVAAWIRLRGELLPGVAPSPLARAVAAADFANGLSWILPIDRWMYVNTELTVHLHRDPVGEWIGLDARTAIGPAGIGLSTAALHDLHGPFGVCAESLFVQRR